MMMEMEKRAVAKGLCDGTCLLGLDMVLNLSLRVSVQSHSCPGTGTPGCRHIHIINHWQM